MVDCPECAGQITLKPGTEVGEIITCPDCGTKLEVRGVDPVQLEKAPEVQEDGETLIENASKKARIIAVHLGKWA